MGEFDREVPAALRLLLAHYAESYRLNKESWQPRIMALDGLDARGLSRLHGLLLAYGWLEQNTGSATTRDGVLHDCYRATRAGYKAHLAAK